MTVKAQESRLWQKIKNNLTNCYLTRIESSTINGIPDIHAVNRDNVFWIELKSDEANYPKLNKWQIVWINKYVKAGGKIIICKETLSKIIILPPASQLLNRRKNPHIAKYYDKRFEQEIKKYESDNLRRYKRFERLADKAEKKDQYAAAINAEYRSGQLAGAFIDRKEVRVTGLEGMSREELENKLKELSEKIDGYNAKTIDSEEASVSEES